MNVSATGRLTTAVGLRGPHLPLENKGVYFPGKNAGERAISQEYDAHPRKDATVDLFYFRP